MLYIINEMTFSGYNVYSLDLLYIIAILLGILVIISKNPKNRLLGIRLSNSGDPLKLLIPSNSWKSICGWTNHSCRVISHKMILSIILVKEK